MTTTVTALQNVVDDDAETIVIAGDRGRGQARPFGAADLAAVLATCSKRCRMKARLMSPTRPAAGDGGAGPNAAAVAELRALQAEQPNDLARRTCPSRWPTSTSTSTRSTSSCRGGSVGTRGRGR